MAQRSGINRGLMWLRKVLQITEATDSPRVLSEIAGPTIDLFGWDLPLYERAITVTAGATLTSRLTAVPTGEAHLFLTCSAMHDEAATDHILNIHYRDIAGVETDVTPGQVVTADQPVTINRPILVQAGARLTAQSADSVPIGSDLIIRGHFVRLEAGQYIPASPWG